MRKASHRRHLAPLYRLRRKDRNSQCILASDRSYRYCSPLVQAVQLSQTSYIAPRYLQNCFTIFHYAIVKRRMRYGGPFRMLGMFQGCSTVIGGGGGLEGANGPRQTTPNCRANQAL